MFLIVYYLIASALAAKCQASDNNCATDKCDVTIGDKTYCSQCEANYVPIDGICKPDSDKAGNTCTNGACQSCAANYFLYKGGCYKKGQDPGQAICKDTTDTTAGVCKTCAEGYFTVSGATDKTKDSCLACGDENCAECTAGTTPQKCSKCKTSGKMYLKKNSPTDPTGTCVDAKECTDGNTYYTDDADPKTCKACSTITGCSTCSSATVCTRCQEQKYLKVTDNDTQCVDGASNCGQGQFGKPDADKGNKCVSCKDQTDGVTDCETCEYNTATSKIKCTKCGADKYLKTAADGATTCETNCGDGYFQHIATGGLKTCQLCAAGTTTAPAVSGIQNCASCTYTSSTLKCTACGSGYKLEGEACVPAGVNLSTGAIAGISVAAVVVVGGLVGFLCWWFVCRGKA